MSAWDVIAKGAASLVQKSRTPMAEHDAVNAFLKTPAGQAAYQDYCDEKAAAMSPTEADAGAVTKAQDAAWSAIETAARALVEKSGSPLSEPQAVNKILETEQGRQLYADYLAAGRGEIPAPAPVRRAPAVRKAALTDAQERFVRELRETVQKAEPVRFAKAEGGGFARARLREADATASLLDAYRIAKSIDDGISVAEAYDWALDERIDLAKAYDAAYEAAHASLASRRIA